jgi:hypothetical protein
MRHAHIALLACLLLAPSAPTARQPSAGRAALLVADVELVQYAPPDPRCDQAEDAARAAMLSRRIRMAVTASGHYHVPDRGKADREQPYPYLLCKACIFDRARERGARFVLVTWVQKESRLILMVNMAPIDTTHPDREFAGGSVDLRGDTDAIWLAGASQMLDRTLGVAMTS